MSTTDTRAAFKAWAEREGYDTAHTHDGIKWLWLNPMTADLSKAYQAATEAAKATGTAGEQEPPIGTPQGLRNYAKGYAAGRKRERAEAARQPAPVVAVKTWQERADMASRANEYVEYPQIYMKQEIAELRAALAATAAPVLMPGGVTIKAFQAAHDKAWHITIKHPFGTSSVRMSDQRDIQLAELIAATNRSQP